MLAIITFTEKHDWNQTTPVPFPARLLLPECTASPLHRASVSTAEKWLFFPLFFFFLKKLLIFHQLYCHFVRKSVKEQRKAPG